MIRSLLFLLIAFTATGQVIPGRYIVEFSAEPAATAVSAEGRSRTAAMAARRTAIRAQHDAVERQITAMNGRVRHRVENLSNAMVVEIDDGRADELRSLDGVKSVQQDEVARLHLDRAVAVHKIPEAWNALPGGRDNAGAGIKVGIIDSGIMIDHPGFQDDSLLPLAGFPKSDVAGNLAYTNKKVIVARNYSVEVDARDINGHGTAVAMAAAGVFHTSPAGQIAGVAPKAFLGVYKVANAAGSSAFSSFLAALDDAFADGMDVVNYSAGAAVTTSSSLGSIFVAGVERAVGAGMLVVISAGNSGPEASTVGTPGIAPSAITVAASGNERIFRNSAKLGDSDAYAALVGTGPTATGLVTGTLVDLTKLGGNGLACDPLPKDGVSGKVVLILRGDCTFETKLNLASAAGAIGAVVYNNLPNSALVRMNVASATLPAMFISAEDGADARAKLAVAPNIAVGLDFSPFLPFTVTSNRMASFSSAGPTAVATLKPDITAVGTNFYTATQKTNPSGEVYDTSGWIETQGTSFSAPLVAGAVALLKAARPGLTARQYRSLIINSGRPLPLGDTLANPAVAGSGLLDLPRALGSNLAASPTSIDFGAAAGKVNGSVDVAVTNLGAATDTFTIAMDSISGSTFAVASASTITLDPGATQTLKVTLNGEALDPGSYAGFVRLTGTTGATETRIPYWFGAAGKTPSAIAILQTAGGPARQAVTRAIVFRIVDQAGLPLDATPTVDPDASGARVSALYTTGDIPGTYAVDVRLGATSPTFTITAGDVKQTVLVPVK